MESEGTSTVFFPNFQYQVFFIKDNVTLFQGHCGGQWHEAIDCRAASVWHLALA